MKKLILAPSALSANFAALGDDLRAAETAGAHYIHWDVMDGVFVPNISFGLPVVRSARRHCNLFFDVHLMITKPLTYARQFIEAGADSVTAHVETLSDPEIREWLALRPLAKIALAVNPYTPLETVLPYVGALDTVLLMSVEPGFGGQPLIPETLTKAARLADFLRREGLATDIQMDGGIDLTTLPSVLAAGVNIVVAGSAVFGKGDIHKAVQDFRIQFSQFSKISESEGSNPT